MTWTRCHNPPTIRHKVNENLKFGHLWDAKVSTPLPDIFSSEGRFGNFSATSFVVCHLCLEKTWQTWQNSWCSPTFKIFISPTGKILSLEGPSKLWTSDPSPLFHILQHWSCKEMNLSPKQPIRRYNCPDSSIVRSSCCVDTICAKCNLGIYPWPYLPFAELIVWCCWCQRSQAASTTESVWPCLQKGSRHGWNTHQFTAESQTNDISPCISSLQSPPTNYAFIIHLCHMQSWPKKNALQPDLDPKVPGMCS